MPVSVKAGKVTIASNSFSVATPGFKPNAIIFIYTDATAEDTWTTASVNTVNVGMGLAGHRNSESNLAIFNTDVYEIHQSNDQASSLGVGSCIGVRTNRPATAGYRFIVTSMYNGGFDMTDVAGFGNVGHVGKMFYYLAIGDTPTAINYLDTDHHLIDLGWEPQGWVAIGSSADDLNFETGIAWADWLFTQYAAGHWYDELCYKRAIGMAHALTTGSGPNYPRWYENLYDENELGFHSKIYCEDPIGPGIGSHAQGQDVYLIKAGNTYDWQIAWDGEDGGFSTTAPDGTRSMMLALQGGFECGEFIPDSAIGTVTSVDMEIADPVAVIFMSGGYDSANAYGQTCMGFLTADFQCTVVGSTHLVSGPAARFQSSSKAWVSNAVSPAPVGASRTLGTATLTSTGFDYTTTEHSSDDVHTVKWWAIGEEGECSGGAGGDTFIPHIYKILHY